MGSEMCIRDRYIVMVVPNLLYQVVGYLEADQMIVTALLAISTRAVFIVGIGPIADLTKLIQ